MIFISQSGFLDPQQKLAWDAWYVEHLRIMVTVDGISSAQRLETDSPGHPPSLAIYTVTGPEVFTDPYYLSIRGMGHWQPLIDARYYLRNLFRGLEAAPDIRGNQRLLVVDSETPDVVMDDVDFDWLECVGLDHSTPYRGIACCPVENLASGNGGIAVYSPVTPVFGKV